jgi:hypothetical protein
LLLGTLAAPCRGNTHAPRGSPPLSAFERRERRIDMVEYLALAEAFGCDPLTLLGEVLKN